MCSKGTSSASIEHTRLYLIRPKSSSWSWLNLSDFSSVAGYSPTGIETRPKEMAPFHMTLGMSHLRGRNASLVGRDGHSTAGLRLARPSLPTSPLPLPLPTARSDGRPPRSYDGGMPSRRSAGPAFTIEYPKPLPAERRGEHWWMQVDGRELRFSNLDKVFWPDEGYTKGDLVAYYFNVAPRILPYLAERPLTMKRMPNGVKGQFFYEKSAPSHTPDWMPRCAVESQETGEGRWGPPKHEVIDYLMVEN